jgi:hypothetical protein
MLKCIIFLKISNPFSKIFFKYVLLYPTEKPEGNGVNLGGGNGGGPGPPGGVTREAVDHQQRRGQHPHEATRETGRRVRVCNYCEWLPFCM